MRVPRRGLVQPLDADLAEKLERGAEAEVDVGEEQPGASEDEIARLRRGGREFVGQEGEHGGEVGGDDGGSEELRGEVVEAGDVGVGEGA